MKLEPIIEMPCMISGHYRQLVVHVFHGKVTVADMNAIEASSEKFHAKITDRLVELVIILPSESKMTSEERTKMTRIIKRWENTRIASATVVLTQGLKGALDRSVLTGFHLVAPPPHPMKVFGAINEGVHWIAPYVQKSSGAEADANALLNAIGDLIAHFHERPVKAPITNV